VVSHIALTSCLGEALKQLCASELCEYSKAEIIKPEEMINDFALCRALFGMWKCVVFIYYFEFISAKIIIHGQNKKNSFFFITFAHTNN
jgi:hypothetical protein